MKYLHIFVLAISLLTVNCAQAKELFIALSPFQDKAAAKKQARDMLEFLSQLEAGSNVIFMDGYHLKQIGSFSIPQNQQNNSLKTLLRKNRSTIAPLMRFATNASGNGNYVRTPQLLQHIAQNYPSAELRDVIIIGTPYYVDQNSPAYSMDGGLIRKIVNWFE